MSASTQPCSWVRLICDSAMWPRITPSRLSPITESTSDAIASPFQGIVAAYSPREYWMGCTFTGGAVPGCGGGTSLMRSGYVDARHRQRRIRPELETRWLVPRGHELRAERCDHRPVVRAQA